MTCYCKLNILYSEMTQGRHLFSVEACCNKASWGIASDDGLQFQGLSEEMA